MPFIPLIGCSIGRLVLGIVLLIGVLYVLAGIALYIFQRQAGLCARGAAIKTTPAAVGMRYEEVELVASDGVRLAGWVPAVGRRAGHGAFLPRQCGQYIKSDRSGPKMHIDWVWEFCCLTIAAMARARARPLRKVRTAMPRRLGTTWCKKPG